MAQILNLSKYGTKQQVAEAHPDQYDDIAAGGYICTIVDAILDTTKEYIRLDLDIAEGPFKGYFQALEDRAGCWGLSNYSSFKESQLGRFSKLCTCFGLCNPGYEFDPFRAQGIDVDTLKGKQIGVVISKEEYRNRNGEIREKNRVANLTELDKIRAKKYNVPPLKKLDESATQTTDNSFVSVADDAPEEIPFG